MLLMNVRATWQNDQDVRIDTFCPIHVVPCFEKLSRCNFHLNEVQSPQSPQIATFYFLLGTAPFEDIHLWLPVNSYGVILLSPGSADELIPRFFYCVIVVRLGECFILLRHRSIAGIIGSAVTERDFFCDGYEFVKIAVVYGGWMRSFCQYV